MKERLQKSLPTTKSSDMKNIHKEIVIDNRIHVKGLSPETNEEELENFFKSYGLVVSKNIVRDNYTGQSKGYGFITFDSQQVAQYVLSSVTKIELNNVEVMVSQAKIRRSPPQKSPRYNSGNETTFYETNIQNQQFMSAPLPCQVALPEGYLIYANPHQNTPYYSASTMPYHQEQPITMEPNVDGSNNINSMNRSQHSIVNTNNSTNEFANNVEKNKIYKNENIVNSCAKIKSNVVLTASSNLPNSTTTSLKINNKIKASLYTTQQPQQTTTSRDIITGTQQPTPSITPSYQQQFPNNISGPTSIATVAGGPNHVPPNSNTNLIPLPPANIPPHFLSFNHSYQPPTAPPHQTIAINDSPLKSSNNLLPTNTGIAGVELMNNGMANMFPSCYCVPIYTHQQQHMEHPNFFIKPEFE